jgi:hypothetical protein
MDSVEAPNERGQLVGAPLERAPLLGNQRQEDLGESEVLSAMISGDVWAPKPTKTPSFITAGARLTRTLIPRLRSGRDPLGFLGSGELRSSCLARGVSAGHVC